MDFARTWSTWVCGIKATGKVRLEEHAGQCWFPRRPAKHEEIPSEETSKEATLCERAGTDIPLGPESAVCQAVTEPSAWMYVC